jgi:hypothetical protein
MEEVKKSANAASKVRALFKTLKKPLTLSEINQHHQELKPTEISMALSYLRNNRYLSREQIANTGSKGRKQVYIYTYHETKLPKDDGVKNEG